MKSIGEVIKQYRQKINMTQEELGKKMYVTKQAVSKWENGKTLPDINTIKKLSEILNIPRNDIFGDEEILEDTIDHAKKYKKYFMILIAVALLSGLMLLIFWLIFGVKSTKTERYSFYNEFDITFDWEKTLKILENQGYSTETYDRETGVFPASWDELPNVYDEKYREEYRTSYPTLLKKYKVSQSGKKAGVNYVFFYVFTDEQEAHRQFEYAVLGENDKTPVMALLNYVAESDYLVRFGNVIVSGNGEPLKYIAEIAGIEVKPLSVSVKPEIQWMDKALNAELIKDYLCCNGYTLYERKSDIGIKTNHILYFINYSDGSLLQMEYISSVDEKYNFSDSEMYLSDFDAFSERFERYGTYGITILYNDSCMLSSVENAWDDVLTKLYEKVNADTFIAGIAVFRYEDKNISEELKTEDFETLKNIFADKELHKGKTECGFTDDVSIRINGLQTFCFACDGCVIVYWKEMDMYFELDDEEYEISHGILEKYGFLFPCILL